MKNRVYFYSPHDWSNSRNLELAETAIKDYENKSISELPDAIELYNIKLLLDSGHKLNRWTDEEFNRLKAATKNYRGSIAQFVKSLTPDCVACTYCNLDWDYKRGFWEIIDWLKCFNIISIDFIKYLIDSNINELRNVLVSEHVVENYKDLIRDKFLSDPETAEILIDKYIAHKDFQYNRKIVLPSNLNRNDKDKIINNYLDCDDPNLNYVELISQNKDDKEKLFLFPATKAKAEKLVQKLNKKLLEDPNAIKLHIEWKVSFSDAIGIPPKEFHYEESKPVITYSNEYIRKCDHITLVNNCITLFEWMNRHYMVTLINKWDEVDTFEALSFNRSLNAYPDYEGFKLKNQIARVQLLGYNNVLFDMHTSFEQELKLFYEQIIRVAFNYKGLSLNFPNSNETWFNKCRILFPELESVVRQYNSFITNKTIDPDIIRYEPQIKTAECKSLIANKYYEINHGNKIIDNILYYLFDPSSMLEYVHPKLESEFHCFYDLLKNTTVNYDQYEDYQRCELDFLITEDIIQKDNDGIIHLKDEIKGFILYSLRNYGACAYYHYSQEGQTILDDMFSKGWLKKTNKLLTTEEQRYFSYYLDNSQFTNGLAYRNSYAHGNTESAKNEKAHMNAYSTLLRLLTILILKISDDLGSACSCNCIRQ